MEERDLLSIIKECNTFEYFHNGSKNVVHRGICEIFKGIKYEDLDTELKEIIEHRKSGDNMLLNYMTIDDETIVYIGYVHYQNIMTRVFIFKYTEELVFTMNIEFPSYWQGIVGKELKTREDIEKFLNGK